MLKDKIPEANERINSSLLKSDMDRARLYLHTMKSSLANVGFVAPSKLAADLEHAVIKKDENFYDNNIGTFSDALDDIGKALEKVFENDGAVSYSRSGNEDEFVKMLTAILEEFDNFRFMEAKEAADNMTQIDFGQKKNKTVSDLVLALDSFDYDKASGIIKAVL
jgi:HPt (histidine-containing phosphotransfer) domain-containing protein